MTMVHVLGLNREKAAALFQDLGEPTYRAQQLLSWVHQKQVLDFSLMHNFSLVLRDKFTAVLETQLPVIKHEQISQDGTIKWLMGCASNSVVETVFIPEKSRGTLCISSQVGCGLNCSFCATGKQGFQRNLTTAEIVSQLWLANQRLNALYPDKRQSVTNVVFMGMGEPLLNEKSVIDACDIMLDDCAYGLSKHRVTVSTSGLVPSMKRLKEQSKVALAVSLHAPNDALRDTLVPINKKFPLDVLIPLCRDYFSDEPRRCVTFEYVMLRGVNDQVEHAKGLLQLLQYVPCKLNLIPFNPFPGAAYECTDLADIQAFQQRLMRGGIVTTIRKTRGDDIDGACGQLSGQGQIMDLTFRTEEGRARRRARLALNEGGLS